MGFRFNKPAFRLGQERNSYSLTPDKSLFTANFFEVTLDAADFVNHRQRNL